MKKIKGWYKNPFYIKEFGNFDGFVILKASYVKASHDSHIYTSLHKQEKYFLLLSCLI